MCDVSERTVKHPSETMKQTGLCGKCRIKIRKGGQVLMNEVF